MNQLKDLMIRILLNFLKEMVPVQKNSCIHVRKGMNEIINLKGVSCQFCTMKPSLISNDGTAMS